MSPTVDIINIVHCPTALETRDERYVPLGLSGPRTWVVNLCETFTNIYSAVSFCPVLLYRIDYT